MSPPFGLTQIGFALMLLLVLVVFSHIFSSIFAEPAIPVGPPIPDRIGNPIAGECSSAQSSWWEPRAYVIMIFILIPIAFWLPIICFFAATRVCRRRCASLGNG